MTISISHYRRRDGLHLAKDDSDAAARARQLPPPMLLGVSCYADMRRAQDAHRER